MPWQRSLRWERPSLDVRRVLLGVLLGALATGIELVGFGVGMQWQIAREVRHAPVTPVQVSLIEEQVLPIPPEPEVPAKGAAPQTQAFVPRRMSRPGNSSVRVEAPRTPELLLFYPDGRLRLPESAAPSQRDVGFGAHSLPLSDLFARRNPVPYAPTYFEGAWARADESLGAELVRRTTISRTLRTPWGTRIGCAVSLTLAVVGGCGWGYAPTATIEELKAMRADLPAPRPSTDDVATTGVPLLTEEPAGASGP